MFCFILNYILMLSNRIDENFHLNDIVWDLVSYFLNFISNGNLILIFWVYFCRSKGLGVRFLKISGVGFDNFFSNQNLTTKKALIMPIISFNLKLIVFSKTQYFIIGNSKSWLKLIFLILIYQSIHINFGVHKNQVIFNTANKFVNRFFKSKLHLIDE